MEQLTKEQVKKLKKIAHHLKPLVQIGQKGITDTLISAVNQALEDHELIKIKFIDHKDEKKEVIAEIVKQTKSLLVTIIGNVAIVYKESSNEEKREISAKL